MAKLRVFKTTKNPNPRAHHLFGIDFVIFNFIRYIFIGVPFRCFSVKASKDKKRKYFNFSVQDNDNMYHGFCFSAKKYNLFNKIQNDNTSNGVEIKRFRSSDINDDIIVNDFICVKRTEVNLKERSSM